MFNKRENSLNTLYVSTEPLTFHSILKHTLSYFSFQPVLHNWCNKGRDIYIYIYIYIYILSCLWDDAYKITIAANRKE